MHVITREYSYIDPINWLQDIKDLPGLKVIRLPAGYPSIFFQQKNKYLNFLIRGYHYLFLIFNRKKIRHDYASLWIKNLVLFASEYIQKEGIKNLIVSGPPSSLHLAGALIKSELPWLRLIQDYRDPWTNDPVASLKNIKSFESRIAILGDESLALSVADHIVVVTKQMKNELQNIFSIDPEKVNLIPNGYDRDDYRNLGELKSRCVQKKIKVAYFGYLGLNESGRLLALNLIGQVLDSMPNGLGDRFEFYLYSDLPEFYFSTSKSSTLRKSVKCLTMLPPNDLMMALMQADICLSINRQEDGYAIASKVYDYIGAKKPILQVAPPGEASSFLSNAGQYVFNYNFEQALHVLQKVLRDYDSHAGLSIVQKDIYEEYDVENIAIKYANLLVN